MESQGASIEASKLDKYLGIHRQFLPILHSLQKGCLQTKTYVHKAWEELFNEVILFTVPLSPTPYPPSITQSIYTRAYVGIALYNIT